MATKFGVTFLSGYLITSAGGNAYEVPSSLDRVVINSARVVNYGNTPETFTIEMVPNGGSSADRYKAIVDRDIAAGESILLSEIIGEGLDTGDFIYAQASTDTKLSLSVGGTTFDT